MNLRSLFVFAGTAGLLGFAGTASAGTPDPNVSSWPRHVNLVGRNAVGVSDPAGTLDFHVTRASGVEEPWMIVFDLTNAPDLDLCLEQDPGVILQCDAGGQRYVRVFCDNHGRASFRLVGHADHAAPGTNAPSLSVYVDGVPFGTIPIAAFDQDGNGVNPSDQSLWLQDYFSGQYWERSDFDGDGVLGPNDLSLWRQAFFGDGSISNCAAASCP